MVRAYIYLISFKNTNNIYIGKTTNQDVYKRFKTHKADCCSSVNLYVKEKLNDDWSDVCIDIIDSVDMNEDLTHLLNHPSNTINSNLSSPKYDYKKYTGYIQSNKGLLKDKLAYTECFHIHNYNNNENYNLINKQITNSYDVYDKYKFYHYLQKK